MRTVATRIRTLFIPCILALIFGILLFQTDRALMKDEEKQRLSKPSTLQSTATNSATNRPAFIGSTLNAASANATSAPNAFFAPAISASKFVNLASASPGATLNYTVTIGNAGADPALGVMFSDTIDPNTTLVPGSVNTSPLALTDTYASIGNVGITVPAANGVLANDFDPDGTIPAIVAVNTAGTQGTVSLNLANGSFTFNPNPGFEGTTTFTYTLTDGVLMDTGLVSITVSGMIWFVDDSVAGPGDGRLSAPFNSIANFNSLAADDPGDNIFVYSGSYTGPLTLLASQKLIGEGATASLASIAGISLPPFTNPLPATGGTRPVLTNTNTNVTVSTDNTIRGVDIQNTTAGSALLGTSFNNLNVSESTVSSSNAAAAINLNQSSGTAAVTINLISVAANTCTNGIVLANTTGSFTVTGTGATDGTGGTIQNIITRGASFVNATNITLKNMNFTNACTADFPAAPTGLSTGVNTADNAVIHLQTVTSATLDNLNLTNSAEQGINGHNVNGFTLTNSVLSGLGNGPDEDGIHFYNMSGTSAITNTSITGSGDDNVNIQNNTNLTPISAVGTINVSNSSFNTGVLGSGLLFAIRGTFNTTINISTVTCDNNFSGGIVCDTFDTATSDLDVTTSTIINNNDAISISDNNGNAKFDIHDNTSLSPNDFVVVSVLKAAFSTAGTLEGRIHNNPITVANSTTADGIFVFNAGGGSLNIGITNNTINYRGTQRAINLQTGQDGAGAINATITGNTIDVQLDGTGNAVNGILVNSGVADPSGAGSSVCVDIGGAGALSNTFTHSLGGTLTGGDIRVRQRFGNPVRLPGYAGGATDTTAVAAYLDGRNAEVSPSTASVATSTFTGGAACVQPAPLAQPIETDLQLKQQSGDAAQQRGSRANSPGFLAQMRQWLTPVFSAFSAPLSYVSLDRAFGSGTTSTTVAAAEVPSGTAILSGETVTKGIAVIPPGKTVTITFSVTIDTPFPPNVCTVTNQGSVSGSNFSTVATNAATTTVLLAPTIGACPTNITTNTDAGLCTAAVTFATPTATGCPSPTVTCSPASGSAFAKGTTTVTCTATNGVSPNSTCSFTVTVNDNQGPTFAGCPTNISANTDAGLCTAAVIYVAPTATDACDGARTVTCLPASGGSFPKGVTTVTCSASDNSGNSNSCSFIITVADNQAPVFAGCPTNISINTDAGLCTAVATYTAPTATDACDGSRTVACSPASGTAFPKGTTTVTCTASDASGNNGSCSFTVTVADNQGPVVTCPGPISVTENPIGSGSATATFTATANDTCDGSRPVTCTPASGSSFPIGVTTVTCTASDTSGNSGSCSFTVTVAQGCTITCPANVTANTAPGQCGANVTYAAPTTGSNCGTVTCIPASGALFPKGTTTVTCSTTAGPSCSFTVTVNDNQGPVVTCPGPISVTESPAGSGSATATFTATANDACDGSRSVTCTPASGSSFPIGVTTVTCSASDTSGNSGSCSFTVTVGIACTISCPGNVTTNVAAGQCAASVTYPAPTTAAGCGTVTCTPASGSSFNVGTTTVTCTTTAGPSCSFTVTVNDNEAPTLICPANINRISSGGSLTVSYTTPTATDNCSGVGTVTCSPASGSSFPLGTTTVTCSATDAAGNTGSCSFTVKVQSPVQAIDELIAKVNALKPPLSQNQANGLIEKLNDAKTALNQNKKNPACNQLQAFINQVNGLTPNPLSPAQAQVLIDCANMIRAAIPCGASSNTIAAKAVSDFDGDGKTDLAVWDGMKTSFWQIIQSSDSNAKSIYWGRAYEPFSDVIAPGDYDGDGKSDAAVFRRSTNTWYIKRSSDDQTQAVPFGLGTDTVVPADYDGDGQTDIAVWRAKEGRWLIQRSSDNKTLSTIWGSGRLSYLDTPVPGDYDGDGKADLAVFNPSTGYWLIKYSSDGTVIQRLFGEKGDMPVPADYDGDGKIDIAVWNGDSTYWHIINSSDGSTRDVSWGRSVMGDIPVPGDFDGDGLADIAVWRPATAMWYLQLSQSKTIVTKQHGSQGFVPIPAGAQR